MYTSQRPSNSLNFTGRGPQITSKRFIQNPDGTFVLSYGLAHARLNMSRQAPIPVPVRTPPPRSNIQKHHWTSNEYHETLRTRGNSQSIQTVTNISASNRTLQKALNAPVMRCSH